MALNSFRCLNWFSTKSLRSRPKNNFRVMLISERIIFHFNTLTAPKLAIESSNIPPAVNRRGMCAIAINNISAWPLFPRIFHQSLKYAALPTILHYRMAFKRNIKFVKENNNFGWYRKIFSARTWMNFFWFFLEIFHTKYFSRLSHIITWDTIIIRN